MVWAKCVVFLAWQAVLALAVVHSSGANTLTSQQALDSTVHKHKATLTSEETLSSSWLTNSEYLTDLSWFVPWNVSSSDVEALVLSVQQRREALFNYIAILPGASRTFQNTFGLIAPQEGWARHALGLVRLTRRTTTDAILKKTCQQAEEDLQLLNQELFFRRDVFDVLLAVQQGQDPASIDKEDTVFMTAILKEFEDCGVLQDSFSQQRVQIDRKSLITLKLKLQKCSHEEDHTIQIRKDRLKGLRSEVIQQFPVDEKGFATVPLLPDTVQSILRFVDDEEVRHHVAVEFDKRCQELADDFQGVTSARADIAVRLGAGNFSNYILADSYLGSTAKVESFLADLRKRNAIKSSGERKFLYKLKKDEKKRRGERFDGTLHAVDLPYYSRLKQERKFAIDWEEVRTFLPVTKLVHAAFRMAQIFGLSITREPVQTWNHTASLFAVSDMKTHRILGEFYLDLYARIGKPSWSRLFELRPRFSYKNGTAVTPISVLQMNIKTVDMNELATFTFEQAQVFLGNFGRLLQTLCSSSKYSRTGLQHVEKDLQDVVSKVFEQLLWQPNIIRILTADMKEISSSVPLSDALLSKMVLARLSTAGLEDSSKLLTALFDLDINSHLNRVVVDVYTALYPQIMGVDLQPNIMGVTSMYPIFGRSGGLYYGTLLAEIFAADIVKVLVRQESSGEPISEDVAIRFRKELLSPPPLQSGYVSVYNFLGRDVSYAPYYTLHGIEDRAGRELP